jgi:hypothetical protein
MTGRLKPALPEPSAFICVHLWLDLRFAALWLRGDAVPIGNRESWIGDRQVGNLPHDRESAGWKPAPQSAVGNSSELRAGEFEAHHQ